MYGYIDFHLMEDIKHDNIAVMKTARLCDFSPRILRLLNLVLRIGRFGDR